jgi:hypothetical protein
MVATIWTAFVLNLSVFLIEQLLTFDGASRRVRSCADPYQLARELLLQFGGLCAT